MLALLVALTFSQTELPPPVDHSPHVASSKRAGLFSQPRVGIGTLFARMGMSAIFVGAGMGAGVALVAARGDAAALMVGVPLAILAGFVGSVVGSALFGENYGADVLDSMVTGLMAVLVAVVALVASFGAPFLIPWVVILGPVVMSIAPPLLVQAFKSGSAQPMVTLARF